MEKLIITAAVVGAELTREDTPYLPLTPEEIAGEARRACEAGASVVHLHARDAEGRPTQDREVYREIVNRVRERCEAVIQVSTGGAVGMSAEERLQPVELQPEMASLTAGTVNFGDGVFLNPRDLMVRFAEAMKAHNVKPELEIFDAGMVANALWLEKKGLVAPPLHFDFVLGVPGALPAGVKNLLHLAESIPSSSTWSVAGIGRHQLPMAAAAVLMGGHARVGLEDNIFYRAGELSRGNAPLVERVVRVARELGREIAAPAEARSILGVG
ncbi:MAG: 3-keto-5-aminohexanoate cleavage protein [Deltaproteobacteria bacterium]|nr:3-keto-5-aminohexanoate cleavage protein [Deltaproteobacteria bacterium]